MNFIVLFLLILLCLPVKADFYEIKISGKELVNVTAIEFKLKMDPIDSFILEKDFELFYTPFESTDLVPLHEKILFKMADSSNLLLRFFLVEPLNVGQYTLKGNFERANFAGKASLGIESVDFVADFSTQFDPSHLNTSLEILNENQPLPFVGISKAEIMGPLERIYSPEIFVTIGNIETYGFTLAEDISGLKINGVPAKLIHKQIVAASLTLESADIHDLLLVLELDVDNQHIKKEIGSLKIKEPIQ